MTSPDAALYWCLRELKSRSAERKISHRLGPCQGEEGRMDVFVSFVLCIDVRVYQSLHAVFRFLEGGGAFNRDAVYRYILVIAKNGRRVPSPPGAGRLWLVSATTSL